MNEDELNNILFGSIDKKLDNMALDTNPYSRFDSDLVKGYFETKNEFSNPRPIVVQDFRTKGTSISSQPSFDNTISDYMGFNRNQRLNEVYHMFNQAKEMSDKISKDIETNFNYEDYEKKQKEFNDHLYNSFKEYFKTKYMADDIEAEKAAYSLVYNVHTGMPEWLNKIISSKKDDLVLNMYNRNLKHSFDFGKTYSSIINVKGEDAQQRRIINYLEDNKYTPYEEYVNGQFRKYVANQESAFSYRTFLGAPIRIAKSLADTALKVPTGIGGLLATVGNYATSFFDYDGYLERQNEILNGWYSANRNIEKFTDTVFTAGGMLDWAYHIYSTDNLYDMNGSDWFKFGFDSIFELGATWGLGLATKGATTASRVLTNYNKVLGKTFDLASGKLVSDIAGKGLKGLTSSIGSRIGGRIGKSLANISDESFSNALLMSYYEAMSDVPDMMAQKHDELVKKVGHERALHEATLFGLAYMPVYTGSVALLNIDEAKIFNKGLKDEKKLLSYAQRNMDLDKAMFEALKDDAKVSFREEMVKEGIEEVIPSLVEYTLGNIITSDTFEETFDKEFSLENLTNEYLRSFLGGALGTVLRSGANKMFANNEKIYDFMQKNKVAKGLLGSTLDMRALDYKNAHESMKQNLQNSIAENLSMTQQQISQYFAPTPSTPPTSNQPQLPPTPPQPPTQGGQTQTGQTSQQQGQQQSGQVQQGQLQQQQGQQQVSQTQTGQVQIGQQQEQLQKQGQVDYISEANDIMQKKAKELNEMIIKEEDEDPDSKLFANFIGAPINFINGMMTKVMKLFNTDKSIDRNAHPKLSKFVEKNNLVLSILNEYKEKREGLYKVGILSDIIEDLYKLEGYNEVEYNDVIDFLISYVYHDITGDTNYQEMRTKYQILQEFIESEQFTSMYNNNPLEGYDDIKNEKHRKVIKLLEYLHDNHISVDDIMGVNQQQGQGEQEGQQEGQQQSGQDSSSQQGGQQQQGSQQGEQQQGQGTQQEGQGQGQGQQQQGQGEQQGQKQGSQQGGQQEGQGGQQEGQQLGQSQTKSSKYNVVNISKNESIERDFIKHLDNIGIGKDNKNNFIVVDETKFENYLKQLGIDTTSINIKKGEDVNNVIRKIEKSIKDNLNNEYSKKEKTERIAFIDNILSEFDENTSFIDRLSILSVLQTVIKDDNIMKELMKINSSIKLMKEDENLLQNILSYLNSNIKYLDVEMTVKDFLTNYVLKDKLNNIEFYGNKVSLGSKKMLDIIKYLHTGIGEDSSKKQIIESEMEVLENDANKLISSQMKKKHILETDLIFIGQKAVKLLLNGLNSGLGKLAKDNILSSLDNLEKTLIDEYTRNNEGKTEDIKNFIENVKKIIQEARDNVNYIYNNYEAIDKEITERMIDAGVDTLEDEQLRAYLENLLETLDDDIDPLIVENIIRTIIDDKTNLDMVREVMINSLLIKRLEIRDLENSFKDIKDTQKQIKESLLKNIKGKKEILFDSTTVPSISNIVRDLRKIYNELLEISKGQLNIYKKRAEAKGISINFDEEIKQKFDDKETQKVVDDYNKALKRYNEIKEIHDLLFKRDNLMAQEKFMERLNEDMNKIMRERNDAIEEGKDVDEEEYINKIAKVANKMPTDILNKLSIDINNIINLSNQYIKELNSNYGKDLIKDPSLKDSKNVKEIDNKKLNNNISSLTERLEYFYGYLMRISNYNTSNNVEKAQKELDKQRQNYETFYNQTIGLFADKKNLVDNIINTIKNKKGNKSRLNEILKKRLKNLEAIKSKRKITKNIC